MKISRSINLVVGTAALVAAATGAATASDDTSTGAGRPAQHATVNPVDHGTDGTSGAAVEPFERVVQDGPSPVDHGIDGTGEAAVEPSEQVVQDGPNPVDDIMLEGSGDDVAPDGTLIHGAGR